MFWDSAELNGLRKFLRLEDRWSLLKSIDELKFNLVWCTLELMNFVCLPFKQIRVICQNENNTVFIFTNFDE
jgi:hypothetical protein